MSDHFALEYASGRLTLDLSHCSVIVGEPGGGGGSRAKGYDGATAIAMITGFVVRMDSPARPALGNARGS